MLKLVERMLWSLNLEMRRRMNEERMDAKKFNSINTLCSLASIPSNLSRENPLYSQRSHSIMTNHNLECITPVQWIKITSNLRDTISRLV